MKHITKIIICFFFITSCTKIEIEPVPEVNKDSFTSSEATVVDAQDITFTLDSSGVYILKFIDVTTNQVISKEKIIGVSGKNNIKIYTKSIRAQYLYLVLESETKIEIKRTKLKIN